ncbi:MAG TPA: hypothetical protein VF804_15670 [Holophagaceae bacterium]
MSPPVPAPVRPRIDRGLARRLDRLAFRAHAFHRWAHHPLCREYEGEVFRLGRRFRLCRGCTLAAVGGLAGLAGGMGSPVLPDPVIGALAVLGLLAGLLALGHRRRPKGLTRGLPTALLAFLLVQALRGGGTVRWGAAVLAVAAGTAVTLAYRRRGPDRTPCTACPEAPPSGACRGFREIRTRERAFGRLASRWLRPPDPVR